MNSKFFVFLILLAALLQFSAQQVFKADELWQTEKNPVAVLFKLIFFYYMSQ
jgi:hypothetical protein